MSIDEITEEPDPGHFEQFCRDVLPDVLAGACGADPELATRIGADILARAESYAALDDAAQYVLIAPSTEEVAGYGPLTLKGAVAVVVRASLLEEAHAHGPVNAGGIRSITTLALAPLSHFLAARRRHPVAVEHDLFAGLAEAYPGVGVPRRGGARLRPGRRPAAVPRPARAGPGAARRRCGSRPGGQRHNRQRPGRAQRHRPALR